MMKCGVILSTPSAYWLQTVDREYKGILFFGDFEIFPGFDKELVYFI